MFGFIEKTAGALVDFTVDSAEMIVGGDGPSRDDVKTLVAAGMTVGAIAIALNVTEDVIEDLMG